MASIVTTHRSILLMPSDHPQASHFLELVTGNPVNDAILSRLPELGLPDAWLVAGCLFQTVWNCLSDNAPDAHILDYDVFYHDASDLSWEAEDRVIRRCDAALADLGANIEVRNQARVHLWYGPRFGIECAPLRSSRDGIDHFLNRSSCLGVACAGTGTTVYAPFGFDDLFAMVVRPNCRRWLPQVYASKAARWQKAWPSLTVIPWPDSAGVASASGAVTTPGPAHESGPAA